MNNIIVSNIKPEDKKKAIAVIKKIFSKSVVPKWFINCVIEDIKRRGFNKLDLKICVNNEIIGIHLIEENNIDLSEYKGKKGVEGFMFGIIPSYQRKGIGKEFIEKEKIYLKQLGYNYIWGRSSLGLNNINFWLKTRRIIRENDNDFYTLMDF